MNDPALPKIELFNVAELTPVEGWPGALRLTRFPARLNPHYQLGGKVTARHSTGCEIRFVPEQWQTRVQLSSEGPARVHFYQGDFWRESLALEGGRLYGWDINLLEELRQLPDPVGRESLYSGHMVRLVVESGSVHLHAIDTFGAAIRKPTADEQPAVRWLAYGSSITQSGCPHGYIHHAARRLRIDVLNKGMSGSCGVEPETAAFLTSECRWDFATLEWGINLRGSIDADAFKRRVEASLDHFIEQGKPVILITIFPNGCRWGDARQAQHREREEQFDEVLRRAHGKRNLPHLHLIEGRDIMRHADWLAGDLVHPTHEGHSMIGEQLATILRNLPVPMLRNNGESFTTLPARSIIK